MVPLAPNQCLTAKRVNRLILRGLEFLIHTHLTMYIPEPKTSKNGNKTKSAVGF